MNRFRFDFTSAPARASFLDAHGSDARLDLAEYADHIEITTFAAPHPQTLLTAAGLTTDDATWKVVR